MLYIVAILVVIAAVMGGLWQFERADHQADLRYAAEQVAYTEKKVRAEVTAAREADVLAIGRERDLALARARAAEAARGAVARGEDGPVARSLESAVESRRKE